MPPLPSVAQVIRLSLVATYGVDADIVTRMYIHYGGTAPANTDLNTFCASVGTAWVAHIQSLTPTAYALTSIQAEDLTSATGAIGSSSPGQNGTRSGAGLPAAACMVVSYEIARRYRGGHPRGYWTMGTTGDMANASDWSNSFVGNVTGSMSAYVAALLATPWTGGGPLTQVNVSYFHGFTVVVNPITGRARNRPTLRGTPTVDTVTGYVARASIGSQRRRTQFQG